MTVITAYILYYWSTGEMSGRFVLGNVWGWGNLVGMSGENVWGKCPDTNWNIS